MWRGIKGDSYIGEWKFGKADGYGGIYLFINSKFTLGRMVFDLK
jgi:hypothetical protein